MKRLLILFCIPALMQTQKSVGQDSTSRLSVLFSPALFVPVSVAAQGGIQFRLNNRWSLLADAAYPTFYPNNEYEKITYWRSGIELKLYPSRPEVRGRYYAFRLNYLYRRLFEDDEGTVQNKDGVYRFDEASIHSPVVSFALILGRELLLPKKKSFADVFLGMGIRQIFNRYQAKNLRITSIDTPRDNFGWLLPTEGWRFGYTLTRFHFTAGVRFGLHL
jgi:hypothetical protein